MATDSSRIGPDDPRYGAVVGKQFNKRFRARPEYVRLARSTEQVIATVDEAVAEGRRLVVTSGGHCLENFVSDPGAQVILDVSPMRGVYYDAEVGAIAVEGGATVGETFRALHERWGVVVPLGEHPAIGTGGHVAGGAFGFLCRQLGLAADYLHAVEVVTVGEDGRARATVAARDPADSNHDLWWAHTGGGAGNFGIVTRHWFRAPEATGDDPATLLPRSPQAMTTFRAEWSWSDLDRDAFVRLARNFGLWCERNSAAGAPGASLWALLELHRKQFGKIVVRGVSSGDAGADRQRHDFLAAVAGGVAAPQNLQVARFSWLQFALDPFPDMFAMPPGGVCAKVKDALLRRRFSDQQMAVAHEHLVRSDVDVMGGILGLMTYGGRINTVAPEATASAQRGSIMDTACNTGWLDPKDEAHNLAWVRAIYRDLFADSSGVPAPGAAYDGCFINHPDADLVDAKLHTSGVPWSTLYYQAGYPRLQRVKARWDPRNVFRHALSIRA